MFEWITQYNKNKERKKAPAPKSSAEIVELQKKRIEAKKSHEKRRIRYKCQKCHKISLIKQGFTKQCIYCGGTSLVSQEWNSDLDSLIADSGSKIYEK